MEFLVLGSVEAHDNGVPIDLIGPRQRAVLARLLLAHGAVVPVDTLIDDLYDGAPPASALAALYTYVSNLRRAIEPDRASPRILVTRAPGYLLPTADVDAIRFAELVTAAESCPPGEALARLEEALRLWRGLPYGEFADKPWATAEVNRLCELRLVAIERRAQALLDCGRPQPVITDLEAETTAHPLRERLWCLLALALYRTGRQADALAALRRAGDILTSQLGLDPGSELRKLENDILRQSDSLALPPLPTAPVPLVAPPAPLSSRHRIMIGRQRQLAKLTTLPLRMGRNGVATAAVSGEPGIGKTRLLEAFHDHCVDLGYLVLWGRCHDAEGVPPLWPWLQVLRTLAETSAPPDRQALAGLLDDERPDRATGVTLFQRNQAIAQWLVATTRSRPLVIILDDLHGADPASLELLRDVTVLTGGLAEAVPLTLVTAFRETALRDIAIHGGDFPGCASDLSVNDVLGQLACYDLLRIRLTGLEIEDVRVVAAAMGVEVDDSTARWLAERTGGNPFFVRESARLLAQGRGREAVPDAVADLIRRRLAALGSRAVEVLATAAVIGRDFDPGMVAEVCRAAGAEPSQAYHVLDRAVQTGLIISRSGSMAFTHDLVRETLIGDIPPLRKAMLHREVMTALASQPAADVTVIAHHAAGAGPVAYRETVHWARAAARQASRRMAYGEAATWWGRAVAAHSACAGDPAEHVELLSRQAHTLLQAGDALSARRVRAEAVRVTDRADTHPELTARALTALSAPSSLGLRNTCEAVEPRLVEQFEAVLRALPETDSPERVLLLGGLAQELYDGSGNPRCRSLSAEAVAMARRLEDPHLLMRALNVHGLLLPQATHIPELMEVIDEMYELALRARAPEFELLAQMMYTHHRLEMFDLAGADRAAAHCDVMLERLQLPWLRFHHTMWRAGRLALAGRFDDADIVYGEAERQAERTGMWYADTIAVIGRLMLCFQRGTMADAGPLIDLITGVHPSMDHDARILELCARGLVDEARAATREGWPTPSADWSWLSMTCLQGAAQAAVGDVPACRETYEKLLPYAGRIAVGSAVVCVGPVDGFLTRLAFSAGDPASASWHLTSLKRLAARHRLGSHVMPAGETSQAGGRGSEGRRSREGRREPIGGCAGGSPAAVASP
ncbi:DNA-binding SARP family transcriptional activator [Streptosporangium becharense]|uniref:DNA-binding SARP family transcriptional activator n=1 Tax=Streptosporangium becharense TaxID=1816182 RepID=A0A7W9IMQ0_9ACTN|nr:BTAD domain-containing putative transcriptional regulator [Streptosporangium becharense]MBB2910462.1 DNA-binding SARP family transcriptional activator [Streptosporangium becharense]MBB5823205.1 DNA-binding SARP family transcriptional activator [Streptosporangium becharense]